MASLQNLHIPEWLYNTIVRIEEQPEDRILIIPVGSVRNLGKTTGLIQLMRHVASKQPPDSYGIRRLQFGVLREAYREFTQIVKSFAEWFPEQRAEDYSKIKNGMLEGFAYRNLKTAPDIITLERTPDFVSLLLGEAQSWDGTYTQIVFTGFSYNKPTADSKMRGENLGSGWVNEAQTLDEKPISTLMGSINRPSGKIVSPVLLLDFNLPEAKDKGFEFLKRLSGFNGASYSDGMMDVYFPKMPAPYYFQPDVDGDYIFEGRHGWLKETPDFLTQAPHLKDLSNYAQFKLLSDDEKRRNLFGLFGKKNEGGVVYTEFDRAKHVTEIPPPEYDVREDSLILMPIDFGYNPGVLFAYEDTGSLMIFKEIVLENINFYELMSGYIIPYMETNLNGFYKPQIQTQIVPIGDPNSGIQRGFIKSAQPLRILLGETDIHGDQDGTAERFFFPRTVLSPCRNVIEHRLNVSKQVLSKPHGVYIDHGCRMLIEGLEEEYIFGSDGKPNKRGNTLHHNIIDAFQYLCAYQYHGLPMNLEKAVGRIPKRRR